MSGFYSKYKNYLEYVPIALITLFFVTEAEIDHKTTSISYQVAITVITALLYYIMVVKYKVHRSIAFLIAATTWVTFVYLKRAFLIQPTF